MLRRMWVPQTSVDYAMRPTGSADLVYMYMFIYICCICNLQDGRVMTSHCRCTSFPACSSESVDK